MIGTAEAAGTEAGRGARAAGRGRAAGAVEGRAAVAGKQPAAAFNDPDHPRPPVLVLDRDRREHAGEHRRRDHPGDESLV
ncbi:hypothetical protein, partial [Clavibacter michiganensis]|uniref:hypothetical protein n=1 Tax=Clavibacter michiganensis TaxID=28447 RepID=UPI00292E41AF